MHHSRRKSGHGSANTSYTDVRKAGSSTTTSSRPTPVRKNTSSGKLGKNPREREREWEEERWWEEERESFPQYCMSCEKQFVPQDDRFLYCSETCRMHDQNSASAPVPTSSRSGSDASHFPFYAAGNPEPRDIIPRASPSRPTSTHFSSPIAMTAPTTIDTSYSHSSAMSALRSLSVRDPSPPSPTLTSGYPSGIWPFTRSAVASPSTSYNQSRTSYYSSTYDATGYYAGAAGSGYSYMTSPSTERPLPARRAGTYSRPKSIELVTPLVGR